MISICYFGLKLFDDSVTVENIIWKEQTWSTFAYICRWGGFHETDRDGIPRDFIRAVSLARGNSAAEIAIESAVKIGARTVHPRRSKREPVAAVVGRGKTGQQEARLTEESPKIGASFAAR